MTQKHDLLIIGAGPAGLTAGLYAARAGLDTLLVEKSFSGGQMISTYLIENYPGFPEGISGTKLTELMERQVKNLGLEVTPLEVEEIAPRADKAFIVRHAQGALSCKAVIIASGAQPRALNVPGEERLRGKGVSYCATCDGAFFKDEPLAVVGGGNSAIDEALFLTRFASRVTIIHRRDRLRAEKMLQEKALNHPKIKFAWNSTVSEICGKNGVEAIKIKDVKSSAINTIEAKGVFIYVGLIPNSAFLKDLVEKDDYGFIKTDASLATNLAGIYAAGDVCSKDVRQVANAVGEGAVASIMAEKYIESLHG